MGSFWEARREATPKITAAVLFSLTAAMTAASFLKTPDGPLFHPLTALQDWAQIVAEVSPPVLLCAAGVVFIRTRYGYRLGLVAGFAALPWFVWSEFLLFPWNSWIFLTEDQPDNGSLVFVKLRILSGDVERHGRCLRFASLAPGAVLRTRDCRVPAPRSFTS
ncbi:membrane hypothetical protein [Candidatus Sulfopaludibacter sp. SbA3]|nr:membrane hypothetical protein [Candidatus Sulfopaludibacter sp. SbA3]